MNKPQIIVVGAGAAGLMAAYAAAKNGAKVTVFDRNEKPGKKLYITGKGRCNFTNDSTVENVLNQTVSNPKFLYGALNEFTPQDVMAFMQENGTPYKVERGKRVFPISDKASDVTAALVSACKKLGVTFILQKRVSGLIQKDGVITGITAENKEYTANAVILATGGVSYPTTGSTGDGFSFATALGHTVTPLRPALCGIVTVQPCATIAGLALKNVTLTVLRGQKKIFTEFGELTFQAYGIAGPIAISASSFINRISFNELTLSIDLKPALTEEQIALRLKRDFGIVGNLSMFESLRKFLPKQLIASVLAKANISTKKKNSELSVQELQQLIFTVKNFTFTVKGLRPIEEAIVTSGGISVKEINPKTMQSKLMQNIYFAGEMIDVDALTGGFNLQIAFSTGFRAGQSAAAAHIKHLTEELL